MEPRAYKEMAGIQERHWWHRARRDILEKLLKRYAPSGDPAVLEIGCGPGGNLSMLSGFGPVTAVEPFPDAAAYAAELCREKQVKLRLAVGDGFNLPLPSERYSVVCLLDVLEHVDQDEELLKEALRVLRPGGILLATVPAHPWLFGIQDEVSQHKRRYTRRTFNRLLQTAEHSTTVAMGGFNFFLFPAIALGKLILKRLPRPPKNENNVTLGPLDGLLYWIFRMERPFLPTFGFPTGVSYFAVVRKEVP